MTEAAAPTAIPKGGHFVSHSHAQTNKTEKNNLNLKSTPPLIHSKISPFTKAPAKINTDVYIHTTVILARYVS